MRAVALQRAGTEMGLKLAQLTKEVIGAAVEVHKALGPGLLESAYEGPSSAGLLRRSGCDSCHVAKLPAFVIT